MKINEVLLLNLKFDSQLFVAGLGVYGPKSRTPYTTIHVDFITIIQSTHNINRSMNWAQTRLRVIIVVDFLLSYILCYGFSS